MQSQTINIALPVELVKKIDIAAKQEYRNRSEFIREATRVYLLKMDTWNQIFAAGKATLEKKDIKNEKDITTIVTEFRHGKSAR